MSQHEFRRGGSRAGSGDSLSLQRLRLRRWEPNRFYHEKRLAASRRLGQSRVRVSRPLPQTLLLWLVVLGIMVVGVLWLEGYVRDQFVSALQISGQADRSRRGWTGDQVDSLLKDTLLILRRWRSFLRRWPSPSL